jgi:ArsR family transcriptional regulator, virulence genes transcriptional regulator
LPTDLVNPTPITVIIMNKHIPPALLRGDQLRPAVRILRALAHPLRLQIIRVIHDKEGSANVGEIFAALEIEQSIASQHLRVLRQAALVTTRRDRKFIYYSLDYDRIARTVKAITVFDDETA